MSFSRDCQQSKRGQLIEDDDREKSDPQNAQRWEKIPNWG